jgi:hypothetical protein
MSKIRKNRTRATASPIEAFEGSFGGPWDGMALAHEAPGAEVVFLSESDPEFWAPKGHAAKLTRKKAKTLKPDGSEGLAGRSRLTSGGRPGGGCKASSFRAGEASAHRFCFECGRDLKAPGVGVGAVPGGDQRKKRPKGDQLPKRDPRQVSFQDICDEFEKALEEEGNG